MALIARRPGKNVFLFGRASAYALGGPSSGSRSKQSLLGTQSLALMQLA